MAVFLMGTSAFSASAQCVVGGTDFETQSSLCNPQLANDETGWFSDDPDVLTTALAGCNFQEMPRNTVQLGMPSNTITSPSDLLDSDIWVDLKGDGTALHPGTNGYLATKPQGITGVIANPKLLDPILSEGNGTNMLVNAGTSHDKGYFMAYTVDGLEPGSAVTLTMDVYYLIDKASMAASCAASSKTSLSCFGGSVQYQTAG
ncbi:MAG TPA: hypothetical protein PLB70_05500, partial [Paludibacteraceae bacterium]|nr:hypothetical protein [Paludibacteraceae bacterium]